MAEESDGRKREDAATQAPEEGDKRKQPGTDNSPGQGGFHHADTRMGHTHSKWLGEAERLVTGKDKPPESAGEDEIDKAKE